MHFGLRRAMPKLVATAALGGGLALVLILTRPHGDEDTHPAHGHHVGELRAEGIRLQQQGNLAGALAKFREAPGGRRAVPAETGAGGQPHRHRHRPLELLLGLAAAREVGNRAEMATALAYLL